MNGHSVDETNSDTETNDPDNLNLVEMKDVGSKSLRLKKNKISRKLSNGEALENSECVDARDVENNLQNDHSEKSDINNKTSDKISNIKDKTNSDHEEDIIGVVMDKTDGNSNASDSVTDLNDDKMADSVTDLNDDKMADSVTDLNDDKMADSVTDLNDDRKDKIDSSIDLNEDDKDRTGDSTTDIKDKTGDSTSDIKVKTEEGVAGHTDEKNDDGDAANTKMDISDIEINSTKEIIDIPDGESDQNGVTEKSDETGNDLEQLASEYNKNSPSSKFDKDEDCIAETIDDESDIEMIEESDPLAISDVDVKLAREQKLKKESNLIIIDTNSILKNASSIQVTGIKNIPKVIKSLKPTGSSITQSHNAGVNANIQTALQAIANSSPGIQGLQNAYATAIQQVNSRSSSSGHTPDLFSAKKHRRLCERKLRYRRQRGIDCTQAEHEYSKANVDYHKILKLTQEDRSKSKALLTQTNNNLNNPQYANQLQQCYSSLGEMQDEAYVIEAPSFIVPYVMEGKPKEAIKDYLGKIKKEEEEEKTKKAREKSKDEKKMEKSKSDNNEEKATDDKAEVKDDNSESEDEKEVKSDEDDDEKEVKSDKDDDEKEVKSGKDDDEKEVRSGKEDEHEVNNKAKEHAEDGEDNEKDAKGDKEDIQENKDGIIKVDKKVDDDDYKLKVDKKVDDDDYKPDAQADSDLSDNDENKNGNESKDDSDKENTKSGNDNDDDDVIALDKDNKPKEDLSHLGKWEPFYRSTLGKFFMDIGLNQVEEYIQCDIVRMTKRRLDKMKTNPTKHDLVSLKSMESQLKVTREKNSHFNLEVKTCKHCTFKTDSELVMSKHLEAPHMLNYTYRCNFCEFETRGPQSILFHMEAIHNVKGRLERAPAFFQCPLCPFEENTKSKMTRHAFACVKRFKAEKNCELTDWEPPAKIPKLQRGRLNAPNRSHDNMRMPGLFSSKAFAGITVPPNMLASLSSPMNANSRGRGRPVGSYKNLIPLSKNAGGTILYPSTGAARFLNSFTGANAAQQLTIANQVLQSVSQGSASRLSRVITSSSSSAIPNFGTSSSITIQSVNNKSGSTKLPQQPSISITPLVRGGQTSKNGSSSKDKPAFVICEICDGYIKDLEQLRNHMNLIHKVKIHPKMIYNRPPLNCQKCQQRFFTDQGLERHLLGTHGLVTSSMQEAANKGKDSGRCPICGKVFQWKLLNHVSRDHKLTLKPAHLSYKCTVCTATFNMYRLFENHVYSAHSVVSKNKGGDSSSSNSKKLSSVDGPLKINDEITIIPQPSSKTKSDAGKSSKSSDTPTVGKEITITKVGSGGSSKKGGVEVISLDDSPAKRQLDEPRRRSASKRIKLSQ